MVYIDPNKQKLVIEIEEGEDAKLPEEEQGQGMLPTWMPPPLDVRRKKPGIFVYDLGYRKIGDVYNDLDYDSPTVFTPNNFFGSYNTQLSEAELAGIQAKVLEIPKEDFKSNYYKFTGEDNEALYGLACRTVNANTGLTLNLTYPSVFPNENVWTTERGLRLTPYQVQTRLEFRNSDFFSFCALSGISKNHITTILDPEADEADFIPSTSMDVFLFPRGYFWLGSHTNNPSGSFYSMAWYLLSSKRVKWRDVYLNPGAYPPFPDTTGMTFPQIVQATLEWQLEIVKIVHTGNTGVIRDGDVAVGTPLEIPVWTIGGEELFDAGISGGSQTNSFITGGYLVAIVKKGGLYYYVWGGD